MLTLWLRPTVATVEKLARRLGTPRCFFHWFFPPLSERKNAVSACRSLLLCSVSKTFKVLKHGGTDYNLLKTWCLLGLLRAFEEYFEVGRSGHSLGKNDIEWPLLSCWSPSPVSSQSHVTCHASRGTCTSAYPPLRSLNCTDCCCWFGRAGVRWRSYWYYA